MTGRKWRPWGNILLLLILAGQGAGESSGADKLQLSFFVREDRFYDRTGKAVPFLRGVNIGSSKPGYFPTDKALGYHDYKRYFGYCQEMLINTIRVYTTQPAAFYAALHDFNTDPQTTSPLMVLHGIAAPEGEMALPYDNSPGNDVFRVEIQQGFRDYIDEAIGAITGTGADFHLSVAEWVLGILVGVEWDPFLVNTTNVLHADTAQPFMGTYFDSTPEASLFEIWLAEILDYATQQSVSQGWIFPMSFVNWVTTDPLDNWLEPQWPGSVDDFQNVDANHIRPTSRMQRLSGYFVNQHVYPFHPHFLSVNPIEAGVPGHLLNNVTEKDSYANYIERLVKHHEGRPFVVSEVGLSTSLGRASTASNGLYQGGLSEYEAGKSLEQLILSIKAKNARGVILFQLADEYFKETWNVMDIEVPGRRHTWKNALSSGQYFGLYSVEPKRLIDIDGLANEEEGAWSHQEIYSDDDGSVLQALSYSFDAEYFYLSLSKREGNWTRTDQVQLGIDSLPNVGTTWNKMFQLPVDFLFMLRGNQTFLALAHSETDYFTHQFGKHFNQLPRPGLFYGFSQMLRYPTHHLRHFVRRSSCLPHDENHMEEFCANDEALLYSAKDLQKGYSSPDHADFNNLAMWQIQGNVFEARIPWMMLGFGDPSTKQVYQVWAADDITFTRVSSIHIETKVNSVNYKALEIKWEDWNETIFEERPKRVVQYVKRAFQRIKVTPECAACTSPVPLLPVKSSDVFEDESNCDLYMETAHTNTDSPDWVDTIWRTFSGASTAKMNVTVDSNQNVRIKYNTTSPFFAYQDLFPAGQSRKLSFRVTGLLWTSVRLHLSVSYESKLHQGQPVMCRHEEMLILNRDRTIDFENDSNSSSLFEPNNSTNSSSNTDDEDVDRDQNTSESGSFWLQSTLWMVFLMYSLHFLV